MKILITGVAGSGKTTIIEELSKNGNTAIDLDTTDLCFWVNRKTGDRAEYVAGAGHDWLQEHSWRLDVKALQDFLNNFPPQENLYIGGKIAKSQIKEIKGFFDKIFLLSPSDSVLNHRQDTRIKDNKFAKLPSEQEHIILNRKEFEDECLKMGAILINADEPIKEIINKIMKKAENNVAYIDGANLHKGIETLGWEFDYGRFRVWLKEKYGVNQAYLFLGLIPKYKDLYTQLQEQGYTLVFKEVIFDGNGKAKGNCDADIVVHAMQSAYENKFDQAILVTSDGDYSPLVKFLKEKNKIEFILSPYETKKCSVLLKRTGVKISYIIDQENILKKDI